MGKKKAKKAKKLEWKSYLAEAQEWDATSAGVVDPPKPPKKPKKGPSRIRLTFARPFSASEREFLSSLSVRIEEVFPGAGRHLGKMRLSANDRLYVESYSLTSRKLYAATLEFLEDWFVNQFPTAVRTFRELS